MKMQPCKPGGKRHLKKQSRKQPSHAPTAIFQWRKMVNLLNNWYLTVM
ncbi:hypothetical protein CIB84_015926 [Bambusicola thoracicus]|uniref:Uncharacterized protein n=1 Tax=Bambusicola thoracicus TaxID=9083 RepID=A0A2P4S892_BAMTH|nr:hypothetical protein CIB84_015926 [Bambusicola thoracicus]